MTPIAIPIDERRALAVKVAGKDVEIAMALGDRDGANRARREMEAQTSARRSVVEAECLNILLGGDVCRA